MTCERSHEILYKIKECAWYISFFICILCTLPIRKVYNQKYKPVLPILRAIEFHKVQKHPRPSNLAIVADVFVLVYNSMAPKTGKTGWLLLFKTFAHVYSSCTTFDVWTVATWMLFYCPSHLNSRAISVSCICCTLENKLDYK